MDKPEESPSLSPDSEDSSPNPPSAFPRVQISIDGGASGQFRITIEALDGAGQPTEAQSFTVTLPAGVEGASNGDGVKVQGDAIYPLPAGRPQETRANRFRGWARQSRERLGLFAASHNITLGLVLFGASLLIYLLTRFIALDQFPIYFFTDEAVQTILAADLVRDNFFDYDNVFLPTFFRNVYQYNLGVSVYLQLLPYLFFGKSILITRGVSVLVSLLVPLSVGLTMRDIFKAPYWWAGALVATLAPAWFLHSRTAFETVLAVSFYALFLYLYLLYRYRSPRFLYPALIVAALGFYSYSPAQIYFGLTGLILLASDARYHWQNREVLLRGALLTLVLALPYIRFRFTHSEAMAEHLQILSSYWVEDIPVGEKINRYLGEYLTGISPGYWFIPNEKDLARHVMGGYGHLLRATLPFMFLGLVLAMRWVRQSSYRTVLIAFLVAPTGAAVVEVGITRLLVFVVPAMLLITLGISQAGLWLERLRLPRWALSLILFLLLGLASFSMTRDALTNGPLWSQDYGLHGMQYGAREVFGAIQDHLDEFPDDEVILSPSWANGTDVVARFFLPDPMPIKVGSIDGYLVEQKDIVPESLFVLPAYEFQKARMSTKFTDFQVEEILYYPNGKPGFYLARMEYVEDIQELLEIERQERARLQQEMLTIDGEEVTVRYPLLDMGQIRDVFDQDVLSVARTLEANPFVLELEFDRSRTISGYQIVIGSAYGDLITYLYPESGSEPIKDVRKFQGNIEAPEYEVVFDQPFTVERMRVEVHDFTQGEVGHVHVWEMELR